MTLRLQLLSIIQSALFSFGALGGADAQSGLTDLPPEVAKVFTETLVPNLGVCETLDLDGDGVEEVILFSGGPFSVEGNDSESAPISFQSLLMVFSKESEETDRFPYRLMVKKSVVSAAPNPIHVTLADLGADPAPEIVWLEGGPDAKGRYSAAIVYTYRANQRPALVEMARFANPAGWIRVHDLDRDGVSEAIAFSEAEGTTVCTDLLFFQDDRWTSLRAEIQALGFPDIAGFQSRMGIEPNGRVTRDLLMRFKSFRATGEVPPAPPPSEDALGPLYE